MNGMKFDTFKLSNKANKSPTGTLRTLILQSLKQKWMLVGVSVIVSRNVLYVTIGVVAIVRRNYE